MKIEYDLEDGYSLLFCEHMKVYHNNRCIATTENKETFKNVSPELWAKITHILELRQAEYAVEMQRLGEEEVRNKALLTGLVITEPFVKHKGKGS